MLSWAHVLAFFSDIHVIGVGVSSAISAVLALQVLIFRKTASADNGVKRNGVALHSLRRVVDEDIRREMSVLRKQNAEIVLTQMHLEEMIDRRTAQTAEHPGRRASDRRVPEMRRDPVRVVEPLHDPKAGSWPIP